MTVTAILPNEAKRRPPPGESADHEIYRTKPISPRRPAGHGTAI
jgi:hypothetical protein